MSTTRDRVTTELTPSGFVGDVVYPDSCSYDALRKVFNGMIDRFPAVILRPRTPEDVARAVLHSRRSGREISVRSGGHGVTGDAVHDDAVCIDLRLLRDLEIDPATATARVGAGLTWGEVDEATQEHGLAVTGGRIKDTGVAGLTLGSGSGWLERKLGFTCDSLIGAEIVTAGGEITYASADREPDLYWAIRGGGGNFGIVTRFDFQLHPVGPTILGGMVMHPPFGLEDLVKHFRDFMTTAPDEVGAGLAFISAPDIEHIPAFARGKPVVGIVMCYAGDIAEGEEVLRPLREFGPPVRDLVGPMAYTDFQALLEPGNVEGVQNYWKAGFLAGLPDEAVDKLVALASRPTSPLSQVILSPMGGRIAAVPSDAMAFGQRSAPFNLHILSMWKDDADTDRHVEWARALHATMQPYMRDGAYLNFVGNEGEDRVREAFGDDKWRRLRSIKARYDPDNVFHLNQNIPPALEEAAVSRS